MGDVADDIRADRRARREADRLAMVDLCQGCGMPADMDVSRHAPSCPQRVAAGVAWVPLEVATVDPQPTPAPPPPRIDQQAVTLEQIEAPQTVLMGVDRPTYRIRIAPGLGADIDLQIG